jgi:hypothetical protein
MFVRTRRAVRLRICFIGLLASLDGALVAAARPQGVVELHLLQLLGQLAQRTDHRID